MIPKEFEPPCVGCYNARRLPHTLSGFGALGQMRVPGVAGFRLHVGEPGARWGIGNADEMLAGRALNFAAGKLFIALEMLLALRAGKFELVHDTFLWCGGMMRK